MLTRVKVVEHLEEFTIIELRGIRVEVRVILVGVIYQLVLELVRSGFELLLRK